jgi:hypothetical protein
MIRYKVSKIAKATNRSNRSAMRRVKILAPVMEGDNSHERLSNACEAILEKIERQSHVFRNVNFRNLYKDII